jgi:hypothetical protein
MMLGDHTGRVNLHNSILSDMMNVRLQGKKENTRKTSTRMKKMTLEYLEQNVCYE